MKSILNQFVMLLLIYLEGLSQGFLCLITTLIPEFEILVLVRE